ncbi:HMG (high mobility group) box protein [Rhizoctonia solani 123E]|uniref:HMG (High mobility group) box protein n=1 Tax=Rhizoctonia solani 123E TaxID=1423351 RepID=A0A074S2Q8_9AGAM|nr:HMG (high mobility group) box protein [Rhizoctonia solani 123E]
MLSPHTKSSDKPSGKLPFTADSIKQYEPFQTLEPKVKAKMCELLAKDMVSPKGNIKRPPNSFMLFRRDRFSTLSKQSRKEPNESLEPMPSIVKNDWRASEIGKAEYSKLAKYAQQQHSARFPAYRYTPIPERKWKAISKDGKKKWFFEFLSLVSTNIVCEHSGTKPSLDMDEWIRDPMNHQYVSDQVLDEILRNAYPNPNTAELSSGSRGHSAVRITANHAPENATQLHNSSNVNDHDILREHASVTLPLSLEAAAYLQPQFQSSFIPSGMNDVFGETQSFHSELFLPTEDGHEATQGNLSKSQALPTICHGLHIVQNQVGSMTGGSDCISHTSRRFYEGLTPNVGETMWDVNNVERRTPVHFQGFYDQPTVTGSDNFMPMSQLSDQGGTSYSGLTDSNEQSLCDYSELMVEFLNPFVLEDTEGSSGSGITLSESF